MSIWYFGAYAFLLFVAAYVRFWTEGGFWQAIHTGRTFMLQAATLTVGIAITHLNLVDRLKVLRPHILGPLPPDAQDALVPPLEATASDPLMMFGLASIFVIGYILSGFSEGDFLTKVGNPPIAKKYKGLGQEPTRRYKVYIGVVLWVGTACLLVAWYFLLASRSRGWRWYVLYVVLPANMLIFGLLWLGPKFALLLKGTEGRPQSWDLTGLPKAPE